MRRNTNTFSTFEILEDRRLMSAASLDPTFNNGGKLTQNMYPSDNIHAMCVQSDGKILTVEDVNDTGWMVQRLMPDGTPDTKFGYNSLTFLKWADRTRANAIDIQPNGKIVIAGTTDIPNNGKYVVTERLTKDGMLDKTFGVLGKAYAQIDTPTFFGTVEGRPNVVGMNIRGDGTILVGGTSNVSLNHGHIDDNQFFIVKFKAEGLVETSFGGNKTGVASFDIDRNTINAGGDQAGAMAVQPNGKIIIAGTSDGFAAAARYNADGTRDYSFGGSGYMRARFVNQQFSTINSVAIAPDGKVVIGGDAFIKNIGHEWGLMRFTKDGNLDKTFDGDGIKTQDVTSGGVDMVKSLVYTIDGKLLAAGVGQIGGDGSDFALIRFTDSGKMDNTFGFGGFASTDFKNGYDEISQMRITNKGAVLVAGTTRWKNGQDAQALARFIGHAPTFSIAAVSTGKEGSTSKSPTFKITRDGNRYDGAYDLNFSYSGSATAGVDFTPVKKLHWMAGQDTMLITLDVINDNLKEGYEGIVVKLNGDISYDVSFGTTTIGIYDND